MYDINLTKSTEYYNTYIFKTKNKNNQTLELLIFISDFSEFNLNNTYCVTFKINTKRKHGYQLLKQTGKDGIKSLLWAKNCIEYFINNKLHNGDKIVIYADDSKRFKVYIRGLKSLKFDVANVGGNKVLIYKHIS